MTYAFIQVPLYGYSKLYKNNKLSMSSEIKVVQLV